MVGNVVEAASAGITAAFTLNIQLIHYDSVGTTNPGSDINSSGLTVSGTCTAFHAGVAINYLAYFIFKGKYLLGANFQAHAAAVTFGLV